MISSFEPNLFPSNYLEARNCHLYPNPENMVDECLFFAFKGNLCGFYSGHTKTTVIMTFLIDRSTLVYRR